MQTADLREVVKTDQDRINGIEDRDQQIIEQGDLEIEGREQSSSGGEHRKQNYCRRSYDSEPL